MVQHDLWVSHVTYAWSSTSHDNRSPLQSCPFRQVGYSLRYVEDHFSSTKLSASSPVILQRYMHALLAKGPTLC